MAEVWGIESLITARRFSQTTFLTSPGAGCPDTSKGAFFFSKLFLIARSEKATGLTTFENTTQGCGSATPG